MSLPEPRLADHHEASSNRRTLRWTAIGRFGGIAAFAITTLQLASSLPSGDLAEYLVAQALAAFASGLSAGGENVTAMKIFAGSDPVERDGLLFVT